MSTLDDQARAPGPDQLLGTYRRSGEIGPVYEVIATAPPVAGKEMMHIRVLESGEELDYRLDHLLDDPKAD